MCSNYFKIIINLKIQEGLIPIDLGDSGNKSEGSRLWSGTHIKNEARWENESSELFYSLRNNQPSVNIARPIHATETQHGISIQFRKNVDKEL